MKTEKKYNPKVSILIINYNNKKLIKQSINSVISQDYKNFEVIFFDDNSTDGSLDILKKIKKKNFFLIKNKKQYKYGSYNQINGYIQAFDKSKGDIIFFLDSDDFFHKKKISFCTEVYKNDLNKKIVMDMPLYKYLNKTVKKNKPKRFLSNHWPQFSPQSCISMRRDFAKKVLREVNIKKFPNVWLDFRIAVYAKYFSNIYFLNKYLTYYTQSDNQESSNFNFLGLNWWRRRYEAHKYIKFFSKIKKIKYKPNLDYLITRIVNFFL